MGVYHFASRTKVVYVLQYNMNSRRLNSTKDPGIEDDTALQSQTAVTAYFLCEQLLLFVFELQDSLPPLSTGILTTVQRQVSSYCCLPLYVILCSIPANTKQL